MDTVTAIAPFVVAGSILPTWTIIVIALLGTAHPTANSAAFIFGNAAVRTLIGLAVLFVVPLPDSESFRLDSGAWDARLVVVIGVVLLGLAVWIWTRPTVEESGSWVDRAEQIRPRTAFIAGAAMTASPGVQYAYLLGGLAVILETTRGALAQVTELLVFVLALQWMLALPVVLYLLFREGSTRVLLQMKGWLRSYGQRLVAGILGVAAAYVIVSGIGQLLS
ncbi:MAG TPA: GAP family protein [Coriobacteriia bacterium]|nr:GAP family protein [Coriobacteriia bacterium]